MNHATSTLQKKRQRARLKHPDNAGDIWIDYQKLINRSVVNADTGCWEIKTGALHRQGYPMLPAFRATDNTSIMTTGHRAVLKYHTNLDLQGQEAIHRCSNPSCVNPDHLFAGTHRENMDQMVAKGRSPMFGKFGPRGPYGPRKQNRDYRYTDEQLLFCYNHSPKEIKQAYPEISMSRIYKLRSSVKNEYLWLREKYPDYFAAK